MIFDVRCDSTELEFFEICSMSKKSKYSEFLDLVDLEPGLFICQNSDQKEKFIEASKNAGFCIVETEKDLLKQISKSRRAVFLVQNNFTKTVFDIAVQFAGSIGLIQLMDRKEMKLQDLYFDKEDARLVFVGTEKEIANIQASFPFLDKVGLVERGAYAS